jgi:hypothetical protein
MQPRETVKVPTVDCDAIESAISLHTVDVEDLLRRVRRKGGFAGPPTVHEARLLAKRTNGNLTDDEWEDGLKELQFEQSLQMQELWEVEESLIAFLRFSCCTNSAFARRVLLDWRRVRLAAHQMAVDHILVAFGKQSGEIRRHKLRSDALEGVRKHLTEHKFHECEVVERKAEAVAQKLKVKAEKPAKKTKRVQKIKAPKEVAA